MPYYLDRYLPPNTEDGFRPSAFEEGPAWSIDFRPNPQVIDGFALVRTINLLPSRPGRILLTDDPDEDSQTLTNRLRNGIGINVERRRFRQMIASLLLDHADDANPNRWNRLRPGLQSWQVWLGDLLWEMPVVAGGAVITESFNQADLSTLGPDLIWTEVIGDWATVSSWARSPGGTSVQACARAESSLPSVDHYSQASSRTVDALAAAGGLLVRFAAAVDNYYRGGASPNANEVRAHKAVPGVTLLASVSETINANQIYLTRVEINGSSLRVLLDGVQKLVVTDTSITTGTRTGIGAFTGAGPTRYWEFDNFQAGDLAIPRSLGIPAAVGASIPSAGAVSYGVAQ